MWRNGIMNRLGRRSDLALRIRATIVNMVVFEIFMRLLEVMFFLGLAGSSIVVLISFFEDGKELFGKD
jgi:hypothetical protein